jgi:hypothetical protein
MRDLLADLVVLVHLAFILFAIAGGLLVLYRRGAVWFHLPALTWAAVVVFAGWICPLTPLENWLRARSGSSYDGNFIDTYLMPIVYPPGLTGEQQWVLGGLLLAFNAAVYAWILRASLRPTTGED